MDEKKLATRRKYRLRRSQYQGLSCSEAHEMEPSVEEETSSAVLDNLRQIHEREVRGMKENLLRTRADMENLRKRMAKEKQDMIKFANEGLISNLLPVLDNFQHAEEAAEKTSDLQSFKQGMDMIYQQMLKALNEAGLEKMNSMNKPFDPKYHDAIATGYDENIEENHVMDVVREGYILKDRVLRPAMVRVNRKPEKNDKKSGAMKPNPSIKPEPLKEDNNDEEKPVSE